jgi:AraC-like DNA-binding protein
MAVMRHAFRPDGRADRRPRQLLPGEPLPGRTIERPLLSRDGWELFYVRGEYEPFTWIAPTVTQDWGVVLPRTGMYRRRCDGVAHLVDAMNGFVRRPGQEASIAMPLGYPDELTVLSVDEPALDAMPELTEAVGPLPISPETELAHRVLCARIAHRADDLAVQSSIVDVVSSALGSRRRGTGVARRPSTEVMHRRIVIQTCELLHDAAPDISLVELARAVAVSPFHLTKIFRRVTGMTISQYRARLRVHAALERISGGDGDLSRIAASSGFADHSHMTRTIVAHLGHTPSSLRDLLVVRS